MDTECYTNYWLCQFDNPPQSFEMFPGHPLDIAGLKREFSKCRVISFNGLNYDVPTISAALAGADNRMLKGISDAIITRNVKPWDIEREFGVEMVMLDHIDLIEVAPGDGSLKAYGGKMHARKLQDLPIEPAAMIDWPDRINLREYCDNDLETTRLLFDHMKAQIKLREDMSDEYGVDLRSKSDAQIAEAVMKAVLPFKVVRPPVTVGAHFHYRPPVWMKFVHQPLLELLARCPFKISDSGGVDMPDELSRTVVRIGRSAYKMGIGGLHSMEQSQTWQADADHELLSPDVAAYYPSLIVRLGIYPEQIGPDFSTIYTGWKTRRDKAKVRAGELKKELRDLKAMLKSLP